MRFSYAEEGISQARNAPNLFNVAPITDIELEINGETLARSSWAKLTDQLEAWGAFGLFNRVLTLEDIRRSIFRYGYASFQQAWGNNPNIPPDIVNLLRVGMVAEHYRRTYQVDPTFHQNIEAYRPFRVSVLNFQTGTYAPAEVYSDWIRRPSYKGFTTIGQGQNTEQGWAARGFANRLATVRPAPAGVQILDQQAGILRVIPFLDPYNLSNSMAFGFPKDGRIPSQDLGNANRVANELFARWDLVELEAGYQMSVLMTIVSGAPNNNDRFHQVRVNAADVAPAVGPSVGPPVEIRIMPAVRTARFRWDDSQALEIEAAVRGDEKAVMPVDILVNEDEIADVAKAAAERFYDTLRDRPVGSATVDMGPHDPGGTIDSVRQHMAGGTTFSVLTFQEVREPLELWRYLSFSTREVIQRTLTNPFGPGP